MEQGNLSCDPRHTYAYSDRIAQHYTFKRSGTWMLR